MQVSSQAARCPCWIGLVPEFFGSAAACLSGQPDFALAQAAGLDQGTMWNTGVVAIANDAAGKAFCGGGTWHTEWAKLPNAWDEMALLRALKDQGISPRRTVKPGWNRPES